MRTVRDERAFSLTEVVVAMSLLLAVLGAALPLLGTGIRQSGDIQERTSLQGEARGAVDRIAREVRQAYTGDATPPLEAPFTATQITFLSPDRATPFHLRRISYRLTSGVLERATAASTDTDGSPWVFPALGAWRPVATSVRNTDVFAYLDASGVATTTAANVRTVSIKVVVSAKGSTARLMTYKTSVHLRSTS